MIYMPGLHTCLLPDRWIAGSLDRWIAGLLDRWIAGSHRFATCAVFTFLATCVSPHNYFTFLVYLNYTRTLHKVKHFLIIF